LGYQLVERGDENLILANSAREALAHLLKIEVAVVLVDVLMPDTDGFELAAMIRAHPRFSETPIIFISAVLVNDVDRLRGYEMGAVDYVPVPVIPEVLRAKVKVFVELYRKTKQLALLNRDLEERVAERTVALEKAAERLKQSEQSRSLALAAGQMGSWEWDAIERRLSWDPGQYSIFGLDPNTFTPTPNAIRTLVHPDDIESVVNALRKLMRDPQTARTEFRVRRPDGSVRWCIGVAAASRDDSNNIDRISGVTIDITERKLTEDRQVLLAEEVDHRARNVVAVIQSIMRLTRATDIGEYLSVVDGRIRALSNAHKLLSRSRWIGADLGTLAAEEFAPYRSEGAERVSSEGPPILLEPSTAQTLALALHELATNAAKYGALSDAKGRVEVGWNLEKRGIVLQWRERDGPPVTPPNSKGYGTRVVRAGIEDQLGGKVSFNWLPTGLECTMIVPRDANCTAPDHQADARVLGQVNGARLSLVAGDEVLVVEDEPLVAMMLTDMLSELGLCVVGPYSAPAEAMVAARSNQVKAAILDVNLGSTKVYPIASVLREQAVPFVFMTGYDRDSIDPQFRDVVVLQKPIERQKLLNALGAT
jgi:PAS domain S-box-containing protein